jgi:hypothetical protein
VPIHAIVGGNDNLRRVEYILEGAARKPGGTHKFYIEITANGMFGVPQGGAEIEPPDVSLTPSSPHPPTVVFLTFSSALSSTQPNRTFTLAKASLVAPNLTAHSLLQSFTILKQIAEAQTDTSLGQRALYTANEIMNQFVPGEPKSIEKGLELAKTVLGDWEKSSSGEQKDAEIFALGHWCVPSLFKMVRMKRC